MSKIGFQSTPVITDERIAAVLSSMPSEAWFQSTPVITDERIMVRASAEQGIAVSIHARHY